MAAADFWTFDTVPVIKSRRGGDVTAEDLAQFQLKIGTKVKKLFAKLTLDELKATWSMADWTVAWDDLVYIYNWVVANKTRAPDSQWSCYIRMGRLGLASSRAPPITARDAIAIAVISDSYISRFTKLDWDWEALGKLKISTPVAKTRASRRKAGENDDSDEKEAAYTRKRARKTPIASTTIDEDDTPIVVADAAKKSIAKLLSADELPLDVQIRVWEGLADWATIERIQVSVAARAVRVPLPQAPTPRFSPPHRPRFGAATRFTRPPSRP